jgi:phage tail-like protein
VVTIAAVGALAQSVLGGKSAEKFDPNPGVVFRFKVAIDGLDLGKWQSCSGLKVNFNPTEVKSGGHYTGSRYLPGEMAYDKLVLKRAVIAKNSKKLQTWLTSKGREWITGGSGTGSTATITLLDSYSKPVMKWKLVGVRPSSWSGPELNAQTSGIAIETLELVHEGFQVEVGDTAAASAGAGEPSTPKLTGEGGAVVFPYPPKEMKVSRTSDRSVSIVGADGEQPLSTSKAEPRGPRRSTPRTPARKSCPTSSSSGGTSSAATTRRRSACRRCR